VNGLILPEPGRPLQLFTIGNVTTSCTFENFSTISNSCPLGWFGSDVLGFCFRIVSDLVENEEACRFVTF